MYEQIVAAAARLDGVAHKTPVLTSRLLNEATGAEVYLKCENFQRMGAFKFRGAYNAISKLTPEERAKGVITYSSGNHAQAIALAGKLLGVATTVIVPDNAPPVKLAAAKSYGAAIVTYDPENTVREDLAAQMVREHGYTLIPPYDHADVIAGQGTAAKELFEEVGALDYLFVPCGGGGLLSGSAISAHALAPACRVIGVEPALADDATRSFHSGTLHKVHNPPTIADGLRTPFLGKLTFPLIRQYVHDMVTAEEDEIVCAMYFLWTRVKIVVEPSGATSLAPLYAGRFAAARGHRVGVILSGGNADVRAVGKLFANIKEM